MSNSILSAEFTVGIEQLPPEIEVRQHVDFAVHLRIFARFTIGKHVETYSHGADLGRFPDVVTANAYARAAAAKLGPTTRLLGVS